ncbi:DUF3500 domain-containing protein [Aquirufa ecclesiirivi]|uniref:DUF3500 domain-containing protein n=1 Tax=Aquirufa ecclesiirivi TaxID=2715124 RepID=UPI00140858BA|nr:DUF3500 domain-containing protein [Aquirufa ecclesiirivi]NHC49926.1 DUF3500 domain-containing protein [Aquirufa ecclesiirivi]
MKRRFILIMSCISIAAFPLLSLAQTDSPGVQKAMAFIQSLSDAQKSRALYSFDAVTRFNWHFLPPTMVARHGTVVKDMDAHQKQLLYDFMQVYLSEKGFKKTRDIMDFEYYLKEIQPKNPSRIPENQFVAFYGDPSKDKVWGWKFGGHHLALNFTIVDNKLSYAPFFFGVYPAEAESGERKGTRLMKEEEDMALDLINSMSDKQKAKAIFSLSTFNEVVTTNSVHVGPLPDEGISVKEMNSQQKASLNQLIMHYLSAMPPKIAEMRLKHIANEDFNSVKFAWAGNTERKKAHYYRIQGKSFLVEFDNTQDNANHIHTVWRDFRGDFGTDLLKEHYMTAEHHQHK